MSPRSSRNAPWCNRGTFDPLNEQRLLCVLDYVRAARADCPCWSQNGLALEPIKCDGDPRRWIARWSEGRAVYIMR